MHYISTRKQTEFAILSNAIAKGLAPDGGLFIPNQLPTIDWQRWSTSLSYPDFSAQLLYPFFADDHLVEQLPTFCANTFTFPTPLKKTGRFDVCIGTILRTHRFFQRFWRTFFGKLFRGYTHMRKNYFGCYLGRYRFCCSECVLS